MNKLLNIRLSSIFFIFLILYGLLIFNLYVIQIKQAKFFTSLAQKQYQTTITVKPQRAEIYDRAGNPLAINKDTLSAFIMPSKIKDKKSILQIKSFLKKYFINAYKSFDKNRKKNFMFIKRRLTNQEIELIKSSNINNINLVKETSRYYINETLGPIIGITDIDNQGISSIEMLYNSTLQGNSATHTLCKDARSGHFYFKRETKITGNQSSPIYLTIDNNLQFLVYEELKKWANKIKAKEGAVLILNPENGDILVAANYPDFNPNSTQDINIENTKNRVSSDAYEFGSVVKIFLAMAALQENIVSLDEKIDCENKVTTTLNNITFSTVKAHDYLSFSEVIEHSNNIGVAKIALKLGTKIYDHYTKLGFSKKIGTFPGENPGFITHPNNWSKASAISLSFGYEISANLLQLAQAFSLIANNGYLVKPNIILNNFDQNITQNINKIGPLYTKETIEKIKDILLKTISKGNAKEAQIPNYNIMGKTGTARLITNGKYDPLRNIFTFAAIVQKDDYKRVVITFLKEIENTNAYAATIAVPLFKKVAHKMLIHDKI